MEFIKKMCAFYEHVMRPDDIIIYGSLVQETMHEYRNIFDSKRW